ncbi:hypothetical protein MBM_03388 [Drepanopeziza brunnea f. sp. 'multigermtubi' MB_m1]|uniref:SAP domain-containing protein n=1 Tax=Marssonina brunnea f. sp. multigermtubi (strain MB_m1) TaxID=1072389 RepID=K1WL14_MARBU|nr:uncharacterized protein MBM_03388 [Drepanopeziza brunnea f. sp. 'multigermtubi' MB_m1]EKD18395.1 hypothetical protein MBM_03388 [Drepanopeziza brunnea f. sp. 'multigermtubi' MB_m1]
MKGLRKFHDCTQDDLINSANLRGLDTTGTRTVLIARLYDFDLDKMKRGYRARVIEDLESHSDAAMRKSRINHIHNSVVQAATAAFQAERAYLNQRMANAEQDLQDKVKSAEDFVRVESAVLAKAIEDMEKRKQEMRLARTAARLAMNAERLARSAEIQLIRQQHSQTTSQLPKE